MKKIFYIIALIALPVAVFAQDSSISKVPKQISFEAGYGRMAGTEFTNSASNGFSVLFDYAWQLSGLNGRPAAFISVPLGYTQWMPDNDSAVSARVISYGWTVRHELKSRSAGWVPYLGYGLMLNNYAQKGTEGRIFGHQTRFSLGLNRYTQKKVNPFVQLDYSMTNYPQWGVKGSLRFNFVELKIGVRI
jgi:hypothetical protein